MWLWLPYIFDVTWPWLSKYAQLSLRRWKECPRTTKTQTRKMCRKIPTGFRESYNSPAFWMWLPLFPEQPSKDLWPSALSLSCYFWQIIMRRVTYHAVPTPAVGSSDINGAATPAIRARELQLKIIRLLYIWLWIISQMECTLTYAVPSAAV